MSAWGFGPGLNAAPPRGNGHKPVEMQSEASHGGGLMRYPKNLSKRADEILAARRQTAQNSASVRKMAMS